MILGAAVLVAAGASLGPVVLRGEAGEDPRTVVSVDVGGVVLTSGEEAPRALVGWERIKEVRGDDAAKAGEFAAVADDAWRARARLLRGDSALALPCLERLAERLRGVDSPTAILAHAGLARARLDQGDLDGALRAWRDAAAAYSRGARTDDALAKAMRFDLESGLIEDLPVFDESLTTTGRVPDALTAIGRALNDADAEERAAGRATLIAAAATVSGSWQEAWIHGAMGLSLLKEEDAKVRRSGVLALLNVPAQFRMDQPALTEKALRAARDELRKQGDASAAIIESMMRSSGEAAVVGEQSLEAFLEASGLTGLLATHLESRLASAEGIERTRAAERLARVYASLLDEAANDAERADLEHRAEALLTEVPDADSLDLRLTLLRSAYTRAERAAEAWRLRLNSRADADEARRSFVQLEESLAALAVAAERRVNSLEKQEESATGSGADRALLSAALTSARRTRSMSHFLAGWCAGYTAELDASLAGEKIAEAERHFGWLLNARPGTSPTLDRVPESLLSYEHVGRSVIGVALMESLKGSADVALRWIRLLETTDGVPEAVMRQVPARKMTILARGGRWADLAALVDPRGVGASAGNLSATDARLLAVLALEARAGGAKEPVVLSLVVFAIESLAAQNDLSQVLDLAGRYFDRVDDLGERGFLASYIRGLREFARGERARQDASGRDDRPAESPEAKRGYASAARFLEEACAADDAGDFGAALGGAAMVRALAMFYAAGDEADLARAAEQFVAAAALLEIRSKDDAARARLMAVRALDETLAPSHAGRRGELIDDFLSKHPAHAAAPALLYQRALAGGRSAKDAAADLMSISDDSPLADAARHQAARLLYERFVGVAPEERAEAARDFLGVAEPLLDAARRGRADDADAATRSAATARRVLDCLFKLSDADPRRARRALDLLKSMEHRGLALPAGVRGEVAYRRVQLALLEEDWPAADGAIDQLVEIDAGLAEAARRAAYQRAADLWRADATMSAERVEKARRVYRLGLRVIEMLESVKDDLANPAVATLHATVAEAGAFLFAQGADSEAGAKATAIFAQLLKAHPTNARFLRGVAEHARHTGDAEAALAAWRGLLAGLPEGSEDWFGAKINVIAILIERDPEAARAALAQHRVLFPDLGPEPWRSELSSLEKRLDSAKEAKP